jgi:beta-lactamase class C
MDTLASRYLASAQAVSVAMYVSGTELYRSYALGKTSTAYDDTTVYGIGSNTKVFTATLLAAQCTGTAPARTLNDAAAQYLPASVEQQGTAIKNVTLGELATHTSSFPDFISIEKDDTLFSGGPPPSDQTQWWISWDNSATTGNKCSGQQPGTCWNYSDWAFVTLGFAVADSNSNPDSTYPKLLSEVITGPLALSSTGADVAVSVPGYGKDGSQLPTPADLKSNARDLLTFLKANLGVLKGVSSALQTALNFTQQVHWDGAKYGDAGNTMGLAWQLPPTPNKPQLVWKNGEAGGYTSFLGMIPSKQLAIAILTNSAAANPTSAGTRFLRKLSG